MQIPSKGRVVHYVLKSGETRPAEVVNVTEEGCVLNVSLDNHVDLGYPDTLSHISAAVDSVIPRSQQATICIPMSVQIRGVQEGTEPGCWMWPPRV